MANRYRHVTTGVFVPLFIGVIGLLDLSQRPRFANIHRVDMIQLLACGMCLGIALTGLIEFIRAPRT
jgi:hypothetical protein